MTWGCATKLPCVVINLGLFTGVSGSVQHCVTFAFVTCGGLSFRSFILIMSSVSHPFRQAQMWKQIPLGKEGGSGG